MTDNEIKKALECCILSECENCPHDEETACKENLNQEALDLINRQQAKIERLQKSIELMKGAKCVYSYDGETLEYCTASPCPIYKTAEQIKSEAIKEFAEKLKSYLLLSKSHDMSVVSLDNIDNLVKEMVGDAE